MKFMQNGPNTFFGIWHITRRWHLAKIWTCTRRNWGYPRGSFISSPSLISRRLIFRTCTAPLHCENLFVGKREMGNSFHLAEFCRFGFLFFSSLFYWLSLSHFCEMWMRHWLVHFRNTFWLLALDMSRERHFNSIVWLLKFMPWISIHFKYFVDFKTMKKKKKMNIVVLFLFQCEKEENNNKRRNRLINQYWYAHHMWRAVILAFSSSVIADYCFGCYCRFPRYFCWKKKKVPRSVQNSMKCEKVV